MAPDTRPQPDTTLAPPAPAATTVLYIEDNASNILLVERLMARRPAVRLIVCTLGATGLELAASEQPSLVLVDMHLPDMSGETILDQLRSGTATRHLPVVVFSADTAAERQQRLMQRGAADYVTKPFELSRFFEIIDRYAG